MAAPLRAGELLRPRLQKAYVKAGYKPGKGNAYTMKNGREIQNRVAEILSARAEKVEQQYEAEVEYT
ncbi:MAG: hypothetical protein WAN52_14790, partial [Pseudolabrys sp.]